MKWTRIFAFLIICSQFPSLAAQNEARVLYFPPDSGLWEMGGSSQVEVDEAALQHVLFYAQAQSSSGVLILYRGRILVESYWDMSKPLENPLYANFVYGKTQEGYLREDVASVQKSVVSLLCGIAVHKGLLDLEVPVSNYLGKGWAQVEEAVEKTITVRHILTMSSGLDTELRFVAMAGTRWQYNTPCYRRLIDILESQTQKDISTLTYEWLGQYIGMHNSNWVKNERMRSNRNRFVTTPRDIARLALLVMAGGKWKGKEVLYNTAYLKEALQPSQKMNPSYGLLFWLNPHRERFPHVPSDLVAMIGALARHVYIIPSKELIIVRFGDQPEREFPRKFGALLQKAFHF